MTTKTWVITGASRGFGRALAEAALAAGNNVVAAVRRPASVSDLAEQYPQACLTTMFDARDAAAAPGLVRTTLDRFGRIDVLVNNAGRVVTGAVEEASDEQLRELTELHLFGPAALVRAALPGMRQQRQGLIVQVSSQCGRMSLPGLAAYSASKFALEGWSEALAAEVAPHGVRVLIVEPSRARTEFDTHDSVWAAEIVLTLAYSNNIPLRLPLGRDTVEGLTSAYQREFDEVQRWADVAKGADFERPAGVGTVGLG